MTTKLTTAGRLVLGIGTIATGLAVAAACSEKIAAPTAPVSIPRTAAAPSANRGFELVLLRPVMTEDAKGNTHSSYATKVVYLRPVMAGEVVAKAD
jgi:hypothetical protein